MKKGEELWFGSWTPCLEQGTRDVTNSRKDEATAFQAELVRKGVIATRLDPLWRPLAWHALVSHIFNACFRNVYLQCNQRFVRGNGSKCRLQIIFLLLCGPCFLPTAGCWVGMWFGPEPCRVSCQNSHVCSQPKRESAGPAKMPHKFPDLPGRQPRAQEDVPFFWMGPMCSLHRSGNHPSIGPHRGIPQVWNLRRGIWTEGARNWSHSLPNTIRTSSWYIARIA